MPEFVLAIVFVTSCYGAPTLRHTSQQLEASESTLQFGATTLGVPVERPIMWYSRGLQPVDVEAVQFTPDDGSFSIRPMPTHVARDGRVESTITYRPLVAGVSHVVLEVTLVDGPPVRVVLEGKGVDARGVPQNVIEFGRPALGAVRFRTLDIRNDFETPVPVTLAFQGPDAAEFTTMASSVWVPAFSTISASLQYEPEGHPGMRNVSLRYDACPLCMPQDLSVKADAVPVPIAVDPDPVQFGDVAVDTARHLSVKLTNLTDEMITVNGAELDAKSDPGYSLDPVMLPLHLLPLLPEQLGVEFSPQHLNGGLGALIVTSDAQPTSVLDVPLIANGGGAELIVEPQQLNFKKVPVGGRGIVTVTIANGGADPASPPLHITGLDISGPPFSVLTPVPAGTTLVSGASIMVQLAFDPMAVGPAQGTLTVHSDDPINPQISATLSGIGGDTSNCQLEVQPGTVDFGGVPFGQVGELGARITNVGTDVCTLWNGAVSGDPEFSLSRPRTYFLLNPGDAFVTLVQFRPTTTGHFEGTLTFQTSRAAAPQLNVPLTGGADTTCLRADPPDLNFGERRPDCGTVDMVGTWRNTCAHPIDVTSIAFGMGTDTQTFALVDHTPLPATLAPNATVSATVRMTPAKPGYEIWPLFATGSDSPLPMLMSVEGDVQDAAIHDDDYVQTQPGKLDLLWVIDNTASMDVDRSSLAQNVAQFLQTLDSRGIDYHIGVTTTGIDSAPAQNQTEQCPGGADGGEAGRLFPVDNSTPRIVVPTMPDRAMVLAQNIAVGGCHSVQEGLRAAILALSPPNVDNVDNPYTPQPNDGNGGFVRDDAALAVVVASNQDDQSPGSVQDNIAEIRALKPQTPMTFSAIVAPPSGCSSAVQPGTRYLNVVQSIGGVAASVCSSDWAGNLNTIADGLLRPRDTFPVSATPDPATLQVTVNGSAANGWHYDGSKQSVVFDTAPAPGSRITLHYSEPCPVP